eukprot:3327728-Prymnesium_polylepis.1
MLMGDSVMEQFYSALQCMVQREGLALPVGADFRADLARTEPLWLRGKRKMPPKLPLVVASGVPRAPMRLIFERAVRMEAEDVRAALATVDVLVVNWGLHYGDMAEYTRDLHKAFGAFEGFAARHGRAVLFQETGAQHFKGVEAGAKLRGTSVHGEWERRDRSTDGHCTCAPIEDFNVNRQNGVLQEVAADARYPHVHVLPFYALTQPRW